MSNLGSLETEIEKVENIELKIERIKELENIEIEKIEELKRKRIEIKNIEGIAKENRERIEIEKERIANLTNKLCIIPKEIHLHIF